jgi:hypothetical protein
MGGVRRGWEASKADSECLLYIYIYMFDGGGCSVVGGGV